MIIFKFFISILIGISPSLLLLAWAKEENWGQAIVVLMATSSLFFIPVHIVHSGIAYFLIDINLFYTHLSHTGINAPDANFTEMTLYLTIFSAASAVMGFIGAKSDENSCLWVMAGVLLTPFFTLVILLSKFNYDIEAIKKEIESSDSSISSRSRSDSRTSQDINYTYFADYEENPSFFGYRGRIGRQSYVLLLLAFVSASAFAFGIEVATGHTMVTGLIVPIISILISFPVVKRLHDLGMSGWFFWIVMAPLFNLLFLLFIAIVRGIDSPNQYGPPPS